MRHWQVMCDAVPTVKMSRPRFSTIAPGTIQAGKSFGILSFDLFWRVRSAEIMDSLSRIAHKIVRMVGI